MAKNLLIVESPAKAKTIEKYLGGDFEVKSSYGHVRDLVKKNAGIDKENDFAPTYEISKDKEDVVKDLKKSVKKAEEVWLATDEDREGEAISWHLAEVLDLDPKLTKRIVFREITKPAIQKAINEPRTIDFDQVNAQQARRVLDRLVGFELSPLLWRKVQPKLSAGRVQSVAVRIVVEREREIEGFTPVPSFKVSAMFLVTDEAGKVTKLKADSGKKWETEAEAEAFLNSLKGADYNIGDIQVKPGKRSPTAPFTTSTLQQEASRKLGYSVSRTMMLAQRLYEAGKISYMRTDSVNLSETAVKGISEQILSAYGEKYLENRTYKNKSSNAQEAHEAIRPTYFDKTDEGADKDQKKLYRLIWQRAVSSQMSDAKTERTTLRIANTNNDTILNASGTVMVKN